MDDKLLKPGNQSEDRYIPKLPLRSAVCFSCLKIGELSSQLPQKWNTFCSQVTNLYAYDKRKINIISEKKIPLYYVAHRKKK